MKLIFTSLFILFSAISPLVAQDLKSLWENPPDEARPWTFWYWMQGAVSREGITADLEAMKQIGLDGAYLMPIKGTPEKPFVEPPVEQLSPLWQEMVTFAITEADRIGLKLGFHVCDGFALAGGPWITPELSMQKVVWSKIAIEGGKKFEGKLPQPASVAGYYRDIAIFAYPTPDGENISTENTIPLVTTNIPAIDATFLADTTLRGTFRSEKHCWIQYTFSEPFTCRSIQVKPSGRNFESQRLLIETSADGITFTPHYQLVPPRHGWQNDDFPMTHSVPPITSRYFRFLYDPEGTEPGSEDIDAAKWKQSLKIERITMFSEAFVHQYEGKNGEIWRVSPRTTELQIPEELTIPKNKLHNITKYVDNQGVIKWKAPKGRWTVLRMGHTSNGYTNSTGGKGAGLECDKFNPEAINLQFDSWFGRIFNFVEDSLAKRVIKRFHVDSWECGSQNWSPVFREEFLSRREYDIVDYLPVMAGIPIESIEKSEKVLHDVRLTISELIKDVFYGILREKAHEKGCIFSAESMAPVMTGDAMAFFENTDIPMSEFWYRSPTHDKPNDIADAVSAAHIYGKNIVQAEAFTELRSDFTEHPALLKPLQDRQYAAGVNRLAYHVFTHNPWLNRRPGMTLDGIGLYFQRDQIWWPHGKAWIDYATRCQALLQFGEPVVDIAVFTGEELPSRSLLPDRILPFLPGLFGEEKIENERARMKNEGQPSHQMPSGVSFSSNTFQSEYWINPLRGYAYDSFNRDALLKAKAENGQLSFPSGMKYSALLIPSKHQMQPNPEVISDEVSRKIHELEKQGVKMLKLQSPHSNLNHIGLERDFIVTENDSPKYATNVAYTHRKDKNTDIYFVSNQQNRKRHLSLSLRVSGKIPELWNPVCGKISALNEISDYRFENDRTCIDLTLDAYESAFIVLRSDTQQNERRKPEFETATVILTPWTVDFDTTMRGINEPITMEELKLWNGYDIPQIRYYSGIAAYKNTFSLNIGSQQSQYMISIDEVYNLATVRINGVNCGTIWTKPYVLDISSVVRNGENTIEIEVANTWANRLLGDEEFNASSDGEETWTNARYRMAEKRLVPSGLGGKVRIFREK